jgi:hypothetical protein
MLRTLTDIQNSSDFMSALGGIDIAVPARIDGREKHHTETYIACRLLSTLAEADRLRFPVSVSRRDPPNDRPDVVMRTGNGQVGIEITEAIPEQFAHLCAVAQQKYPGHLLPAIHPLWDAPTFTPAEMKALLEKSSAKEGGADQAERDSANFYLRCVASGGWVADQAEREWANFILNCVNAKLDNLAKPDFGKYDQNWLAIYDNLPLPHVNLGHAVAILRPLLTNRWLCHPAFDALFVEHNLTIAKITATASMHFAVNNLWSVP